MFQHHSQSAPLRRPMSFLSLLAASLVLHIAAAVHALPIAVGSGDQTAHVLINFGDGAQYQFDVTFTGTPTGTQLLDIISANTTLTTVQQDFGFGIFVDGIAFDGHSNSGFGGGEEWWHYWTRDSDADAFTSPLDFGSSGRSVHDGNWDGWVYGNADAPLGAFVSTPTPEPASGALLGLVGLSLLVRRRASRH